ncbi:uncharacterized protein LOC110912215 [Helianthus annuus]|uniref:uncharacterized protein LOC110912215 n=1 Tax=Helianthus annuus TaxID=4232 RepID=UPI000B8EFE67|nr:uncharacterized protein LOC110912215 [Helianthus annuus]
MKRCSSRRDGKLKVLHTVDSTTWSTWFPRIHSCCSNSSAAHSKHDRVLPDTVCYYGSDDTDSETTLHLKFQSYSRAYIDFKRPEDVIEFAEFFDGHVFVNEKGNTNHLHLRGQMSLLVVGFFFTILNILAKLRRCICW